MRSRGHRVAEAMKQQGNNGLKGCRSHEAIGATRNRNHETKLTEIHKAAEGLKR